MLIFDQLRKNDRQLQILAVCVLSGLVGLVLGLWYVQVLSAKRYQATQVSQSFRTVRIPAIRGKILDANGIALAENRPSYNVNLYLEELRPWFQAEYSNTVRGIYQAKARVGDTTKLARSNRLELGRQTRYRVVSNIVFQVSSGLQQPLYLNEKKFIEHYDQRLFLPMPVLADLTPPQIGQFVERSGSLPGIDLDVQPLRVYPLRSTAAHLLGYLRRDDAPADEDTFFNYRMPDFKGVSGIEAAFDQELRGNTGIKSVLVNSLGFRQSENIWTAAEEGRNVTLTIDLSIQQAAEKALRGSIHGAETRGAAVVVDATNGDLLAVASSPTYDPNQFIAGFTRAEWDVLIDPLQLPLVNRATQGTYAPGSIFKIVVGLAGLEAGTLDPRKTFHSLGYYPLGRRRIEDLAGAGDFDFRRALIRSSNPYFIEAGLNVGVDRILEIGKRLHLGERTGILPRQEAAGIFPTREWQQENLGGAWFDGHTANLCIGQGEIALTPLQVAVMVAAVANGGKIFWPRLVARADPQDPFSDEPPRVFPAGRVREYLNLKKRTLDTVREAMHGDVEESDGTGHRAFVAGMRISAKTGTAQRKQGSRTVGHNAWFASFAPYESPRYAVVVIVEGDLLDRISGGETCAPLAQQIYLAIQKRERLRPAKAESLARNN